MRRHEIKMGAALDWRGVCLVGATALIALGVGCGGAHKNLPVYRVPSGMPEVTCSAHESAGACERRTNSEAHREVEALQRHGCPVGEVILVEGFRAQCVTKKMAVKATNARSIGL